MSTALATPEGLDSLVEQVVVGGDLAKLTPRDRLNYYNAICKSIGLNPLTRPLEYLSLNGKLVLYARKDCTDQLRKIHGVSILPTVKAEVVEDTYCVTVFARDATGREDNEIGAVPIANLKGEARANAIMKAHTKAKRRVTLSICGLGMLDETEVASIPDARPARIDFDTGEVLDKPAPDEPREDEGPEARGVDVAQERTILLGRVKAQADRLKLDPKARAELWDTHVQGDPREAPIEKLADLYAVLKARV